MKPAEDKKDSKSMFQGQPSIWKGDPLVFTHNNGKGHGVVAGQYVYLFGRNGSLQVYRQLLWEELVLAAEQVYDNAGPAIGTHGRTLAQEKIDENARNKRIARAHSGNSGGKSSDKPTG
jgi:hypothetical protein